MYYLHQIKTIRNTIIDVSEDPTPMPGHLEQNGNPFSGADGQPVANVAGWTLGPVHEIAEAERLAVIIAQANNWDVMIDRKLMGLPYLDTRAAAQALRGIKSDRRSAASRENGRKGGRPPKQDTGA